MLTTIEYGHAVDGATNAHPSFTGCRVRSLAGESVDVVREGDELHGTVPFLGLCDNLAFLGFRCIERRAMDSRLTLVCAWCMIVTYAMSSRFREPVRHALGRSR